jgi:hypothetical protein
MNFLNQIFYNYNKFDSYEDFKSINKYMLTVENIPRFTSSFNFIDYKLNIKSYEQSPPLILPTFSHTISINPILKPHTSVIIPENNCIKQIPEKSNKRFSPIQENKLFWCIYIIVYGYDNFLLINQKYGNKELEEKQMMIEFIKTNTPKWKESNYKVSKILIQEMMSELLINKQSGFLSCITMSVFYNKIIIIVNQCKNSYLYFSPAKDMDETTNSENIVVIYYNKNELSHNKNKHFNEKITYSIDLQTIQSTECISQIKEIQANMYCLENYEKPLKGVSTYKIKELVNIANKLNMFQNESEIVLLKKQELYDKIYGYCLW